MHVESQRSTASPPTCSRSPYSPLHATPLYSSELEDLRAALAHARARGKEDWERARRAENATTEREEGAEQQTEQKQ